MEKKFKVYIYPDGDLESFFQTPRKLTGKYASEGYFFQNIRDSKFLTEDPDEAHLFFIPISCHKMRGNVCFSYFIMCIVHLAAFCSFEQPFPLPPGGNDVPNRTILGFWAGHRNSKIRGYSSTCMGK